MRVGAGEARSAFRPRASQRQCGWPESAGLPSEELRWLRRPGGQGPRGRTRGGPPCSRSPAQMSRPTCRPCWGQRLCLCRGAARSAGLASSPSWARGTPAGRDRWLITLGFSQSLRGISERAPYLGPTVPVSPRLANPMPHGHGCALAGSLVPLGQCTCPSLGHGGWRGGRGLQVLLGSGRPLLPGGVRTQEVGESESRVGRRWAAPSQGRGSAKASCPLETEGEGRPAPTVPPSRGRR